MPRALTHGDAQDLLDAFKRAWETRDVDIAVGLYDDHAEYRPQPFEPPLVGSNAIRGYWNQLAAELIHIDFDAERIWLVERTVLASWHVAFTRRATAERIRRRGFMTLELDRQGLVTRHREWSIEQSVGVDSTHHPRAMEGAADGR